ncbi:hypothetical protein MM26B8_01190 [Mycoplasmopsis meleagridis]|uniref:Uncharacterized protein n=1 Tax=Mycoplasmopsis meleagridis ATCC 25294 TaxID=1264554 RepID=A0A0F5H239_9BACT|nr:hypothetical protein [Mycoplasmopsis meleagridis]KKB26907.1 hypothetical protein MMELEA_03560 [Mycoplasmopsis meleagridis ATCC 25294]OAD18495.1 hypothetical protein MM26B8_01190 [Mycoplasmopsis meleagridis]VEU77635.1 Uncharacterised protein [Mycoplasmopsis meleagridis]
MGNKFIRFLSEAATNKISANEKTTDNISKSNNNFEFTIYLAIPLVFMALLYSIYIYHSKLYINSLTSQQKVPNTLIKRAKRTNLLLLIIFSSLNLLIFFICLGLFLSGNINFNLLVLIAVGIVSFVFIGYAIYKYFKNISILSNIKVDNKINFKKFEEYSIRSVNPKQVFVNANKLINPRSIADETFDIFFNKKIKDKSLTNRNKICHTVANNSFKWSNYLTTNTYSQLNDNNDNLYFVLSCSFKMLVENNLFKDYDEVLTYFTNKWEEMVK